MQLAAAISVYAGGPGSGCKGPNCGRPKTLYHLTNAKNLPSILKRGLQVERTGARSERKGWDKTKNALYAFENLQHVHDVKWTLENSLNPNNRELLGKHQVVVEFEPKGRVRNDPEYDDYYPEEGDEPLSARIHSGPVPAQNIVGYYELHGEQLGKYKRVKE